MTAHRTPRYLPNVSDSQRYEWPKDFHGISQPGNLGGLGACVRQDGVEWAVAFSQLHMIASGFARWATISNAFM